MHVAQHAAACCGTICGAVAAAARCGGQWSVVMNIYAQTGLTVGI